MQVTLYGLSRSGKSCYIYGMAKAMTKGVRFNDGRVCTVINPNIDQVNRLNAAYHQMTIGKWPDGTTETQQYGFNVSLSLKKLMQFSLTDYRGGLLDSVNEYDAEERDAMLQSFYQSDVLLFFIGADKVIAAMHGDSQAEQSILFMNTLFSDYLDGTNNQKVPVMLVITKADMLDTNNISRDDAKKYITDELQAFFGVGTNIISAITMVQLGENLQTTENGELTGTLCIGSTAGNIHVPIFYSLFCFISNEIEKVTQALQIAQNTMAGAQIKLTQQMQKSAFVRFFYSNENQIRKEIESSQRLANEDKERLEKLNEILSLIKPYLLNHAEVYFNGSLQK